jgi:methylmalonyl-CoA/ethylmalonyl-CoA epimerase
MPKKNNSGIVALDHIGIVVNDVNLSKSIYENVFGFTYKNTVVLEDQGNKIAVLESNSLKLELIQPLDNYSNTYNFLMTRGGGIHHIAFQVRNIELMIHNLLKNGMQVINENVIEGIDGSLVTFIHPHFLDKVLIELCQKNIDRRLI